MIGHLHVPWQEVIQSVHADRVQELVLHPHSWIRLASSRLFGQLFASCPLEELLTSLVNQKEGKSGAVQIVSCLEVCVQV